MSECCREFSLFINLRILSVGYFYIPYKCRDLDAIIDAVSTLRHLQLLKYGTEPPPDDFPTLQHIKEFEITSEDFSTLNNYSFKNRIVKLATPFQCFTPVDLPLIEGLPNLKELSLGEFQASLEELCIALEAAPKLTHLKFYFYVRHNPLDDYRPTNLTRLSHLTIVLQRGHPLIDDDTLYWLVESIAGRSSLSSLGIMWHNLKPAKTRCEKLLQHLFARHGPTLRKLKLPFFHMTKTIFHRLGRRMPCLTQLWIGATPQMKTWLSDVICAFLKLERLRLYNLDECEFPFSVSCLQQACPALKVIKVCQRSHYKIAQDTPFVRYAWKSTWVYEPPIGSSKRIEGPLKSHRLRWSVGKYYINQKGGYASDSGSDMDFG
ncbi:hypothetical protein FRC20_005335 [Serendipita sp. 405]|nr:hypothetical protein FRC20_005335 [Serendipita sp. 405]